MDEAPSGPAITLAAAIEDNVVRLTAAALLAGWSDPESLDLAIANLTASKGTLQDIGGGLWAYIPQQDDDSGAVFSYGLSDGVNVADGSATMDLLPVNDAPSRPFGMPLAAFTEDVAALVTAEQLLAGSTDPDGPSLSVVSISASSGTLTDLSGGQWSYQGAPDDDGSVTFIYLVTDGVETVQGGAAADILPVDDAPTGPAAAVLPALAEDASGLLLAADLLAGWSDIDSVSLEVIDLAASSGTLVFLGGSTWRFTGDADDDTAVSFTYQVSDSTTGVAASAVLDRLPVTAGLIRAGNSRADSIAGGADNDTLSGLAGDDSLVGNGGNDALMGSTGNDLLEGGTGLDRLVGGSGADSLHGGEDADTLIGGDDIDLLAGGAGNDVYDGVTAGDIISEAPGGGIDIVRATISWALAAEVVNLTLGGLAAVNGTGNVGANVIIGNTGANLLDGLEDNDHLSGRDGNDTLRGGLGADTLNGERGADVFFYGAPEEGGDRILAYRGLDDTIQVSGTGFGLAVGADLVATGRYAANTAGAPVGVLGQFVYDTNDFTLWWDDDGTDAAGPVLIANLAGLRNWSGAEIVVV
ncbi:cadherin-like domain-containing protein [Falsiroseomonas bella]|uniref:cadherin-like domain-containing protein n=1 Tax=Falsiroseomonas bella TaxID=2184016 RepID=UPI001E2DDA05|nr:cadherin-like domain-containing protein [Falsiroseomonas bella]